MKVLVIDNYDSFTWNLVHYIEQFPGSECVVCRNDTVDLADIVRFDRVLLSPGPGLPEHSGKLMEAIRAAAGHVPLLGICLGHQAIAQHFGAKLRNLPEVVHGKKTITRICDPTDYIYQGVPELIASGRYHSWVVDERSLPESLAVTALDESGVIMSLAHKTSDIRGIQFHPESVMTPEGKKILFNWLQGKH
ncbi:MAG: aminodeoxychorismate/anthranilate synthase component II [Bacteroidetes bacterium]|nr:aminodeoxychorismate/anthranilate synthase component II [Bacteroidota bacterium]MBU1720998.1 aminodeoxychorismate/anthranilate synthase component II [Bacteroidota bacterium]